ncbi:MAG: TetR/AcrR family transcriptional regulator, partial [Acidimicrobiales bacterium]
AVGQYHPGMPRGRKRDENARRRILDAAFELVGSSGQGTVTINDIAASANVAKQTIYRWWPSRTAVILDALVVGSMKATPFKQTDDVRADFRTHLRGVIRLFNSPTGSLIRELVAASQADDDIAEEFRTRFWAPRRELSLLQLRRGIEGGQIRSDVDVEAVLDAIYGPLWLRMMIGHIPLNQRNADSILDVIWPGIAVPTS